MTSNSPTNINGIVGAFFSGGSLLGWIILSLLMVSYETNVPVPQHTGDGQRDLGQDLEYTADVVGRKSVAFAANSFFVVAGGAVISMFFLVGIVTSGIGLAFQNKTMPLVGLGLGAASFIYGIVFLAWRWSVWFG